MKIDIVGASDWVNRMFEACGNYQWAREFLKNSIEAHASRIEFGIEWLAVEKLGVYRRTIIDDGDGMNRDELQRFFSTLGAGAKKIGGIHDNFGVGAKIASLPWNPDGVVVISYKAGKASMIQIVLDEATGEYELVEFETGEGTVCVVDPSAIDWTADVEEVDWGAIRPEWVGEHGTIIVLLGSKQNPDTVLGNPQAGEQDIKGLSVYLNTRFWDLQKYDIKVVELRSEKKAQWPRNAGEREDERRPNNRTIKGAKFYLTEVGATAGRLLDSGTLRLDEERVVAEWYLWQGERPAIHSYARKPGYIAVRYGDELYEVSAGKVHFRWFGVVESKVQANLTIIVDPQHYRPPQVPWGVHSDQSRNRLIFSGEGQKGVALPLSDWGMEFAELMPQAIRDAIHAARGENTGSIDDPEYRKRLQDKFGSRWTIKALVSTRTKPTSTNSAVETEETVEVLVGGTGGSGANRRRRKKARKVLMKKLLPSLNGSSNGMERDVPVDVPRYGFMRKDDFQKPWHLACWVPNHPDGPTVFINLDSPILGEMIRYHQEQYPDVHAEDIAKTIQAVFGEVAACKVAHSQKLVREMPLEQLDKEYRNEAALTIAMMGLLAEESLISQRLGKFGRKKLAA